MSVIIIGNGDHGNAAINTLVDASKHGKVTADERAVIEWLITQLVLLAATKR